MSRGPLDGPEDLSEEESDQLWAEEADRRFPDYKAGKVEGIPAEAIFASLRARTRDC